MKELTNSFYSKMFFVASIWNLIFVAGGFLFYDIWIRLVISPFINPDDFFYEFMFKIILIFILSFGFGYYLVSKNLNLNKGIVFIAAIGKLVVFSAFSYGFFIGKIALFGFLNLAGDSIWAVLFLAFLWQTKDQVKMNIIIG